MTLDLDGQDERYSRALAAADVAGRAMAKSLSHMALAGAREAARSALLVLGEAPRRVGRDDLELLRTMAASSPRHFAGHPSERAAKVRATLTAVHRVLPPSSGEVVAFPASIARA